jgi:hypothetical protein
MDEMANQNLDPAAAFNHPLGPGFGQTLQDMRFMGWVGLISGVLTCLSIVGAVFGIPMIIAAHRFIEGINRFDEYRLHNAESGLKSGFYELGRSFRIMKILTIIYIVVTVLYLAFLFLMGGLGILAGLAEA